MRTTARGVWDPEFGNLLYEPLMQRSSDEPFSLYGLLAETVEWDEERTFTQFNINPKAKWSDGEPVTPDDVIFTFNLLKEKAVRRSTAASTAWRSWKRSANTASASPLTTGRTAKRRSFSPLPPYFAETRDRSGKIRAGGPRRCCRVGSIPNQDIAAG